MLPLLLSLSLLAAPDDEQAAAAFFARLHQAYQADEVVDDFFDFHTMRRWFAGVGVEGDTLETCVRGLRLRLGESLRYLATDRIRVRRIEVTNRGRRVVADVDHADRTELHRMRWYLLRGEDGLKAYNVMSRDEGANLLAVTKTLAQIEVQGGRTAAALRAITKAQGLLEANEYERLARMLEILDLKGMPKAIRAQRLHWLVLAYAELDEDEKALAVWADADRRKMATPRVTWAAVTACSRLERHEDTVRHARRYLDLLGPHPHACRELGDALLELGRPAEAADAYRAGLADDPQSGLNVAGLAVALPDDRKAEFVPHLRRLKAPASWMEEIGDRLLDKKDFRSLALLVEAFDGIAPGHKDHVYFGARLKMHANEFQAAAAMLLAALPQLENVGDRGVFVELYVRATLGQGKSVEALEALPARDRVHGFNAMARNLAGAKDVARLSALVEARKDHGHVLVWRVQLLFLHAKYEAVVRLVEAELGTIRSESGLNAWRAEESWVRSLIRLGRPAAAVHAARQCSDTEFRLFAHAANGDVRETIAAFRKCVEEEDWEPSEIYEDHDVGEQLRKGAAFARLRAMYPPK